MRPIVFNLILVAVLVAFGLLAASEAKAEPAPVGKFAGDFPETRLADTCRLMAQVSEYRCPDQLEAPVIYIANLRAGNYGLYFPHSRNIYISVHLVGPHWDHYAEGVVRHELTHWLAGLMGFRNDISHCANEKLAWDVANAYMEETDRSHMQNLDWWASYPACSEEDA